MQCAEFESRLNDLLDQRRWLDADPHLAEHVRGCSECRHLAAAYEAVVVGFEQSQIPDCRPNLTDRVLADYAAASKSEKLTPAGHWAQRAAATANRSWTFAALAAAVLLAVALRWAAGPALISPGRPLPAQGDRAAADEMRTDGSLVVREVAPLEVGDAPEEFDPQLEQGERSGDAYGGLAAEASQSFAVALQLFPGVGSDPNESRERAANDPAADWIHDFSDGLKPVTRPTAGAVNSFLQLLASGDEGSRS